MSACNPASGPLVPPLGTTAPSVKAEDALPPSRMRIAPNIVSCSMPAPSADADTLAIIAARGNAVTNIAANGLDDTTTVATISVEDGEKPVYVFALSGSAMIWNVTGATQRVERFVVQAPHAPDGPGTGVVGLDPAKVRALADDACGTAYPLTPSEADRMIATIRSAMKSPDGKMVGVESIGTINAPSGTPGPHNKPVVGPTMEGEKGTFMIVNGKPKRIYKWDPKFTERQFKRYYPAGVEMFDPAAIVSTAPVAVYDVLPAEAGLLQLLDAGVMSFNAKGAYVIEGPFPHIPAGLYGDHKADFILRPGITRPKGKFFHSSLFDGATGNCLEGLCKSLEEFSRMRSGQ
tara:strand:+ start:581 stop:1624 length:1044 start_codon:yes stop_codon:yes gene_type:complete